LRDVSLSTFNFDIVSGLYVGGISGLSFNPMTDMYVNWLRGHRAAGNVVFAEILASMFYKFLMSLSMNAPRCERYNQFPTHLYVLDNTSTSWFERVNFYRYQLTPDINGFDDDVFLFRTNDKPFRLWMDNADYVYRYELTGAIMYSGPDVSENTFDTRVSLDSTQPVQFWTKHT